MKSTHIVHVYIYQFELCKKEHFIPVFLQQTFFSIHILFDLREQQGIDGGKEKNRESAETNRKRGIYTQIIEHTFAKNKIYEKQPSCSG